MAAIWQGKSKGLRKRLAITEVPVDVCVIKNPHLWPSSPSSCPRPYPLFRLYITLSISMLENSLVWLQFKSIITINWHYKMLSVVMEAFPAGRLVMHRILFVRQAELIAVAVANI
ncbi:unnamed protein product [Pleuronectes platessa]|uniref:Uncharacterized protein n=1 Tax=Pleuronectes platessa TaxID=8262 RepID=A0A9N7V9T9_PLEPL|nr:unnamed protein product [Pleuronectes platessa]